MSAPTVYPPNTLGYHLQMSEAVFGPETAPSKFLRERVEASPLKGMTECIVGEQQMVMALGLMYVKEAKSEASS